MTTLEFIVYGLATWRIASLFVNEDGPAKIFRIIRQKVGIIHDESGQPYVIPERFLPGILSCVWCCSVWVGFGMAIAWWFFPIVLFCAALPFAFSAFAVIFEATRSLISR